MQVKWITFHSGYDFGYLLKVLTCQPLPKTEVAFFELLKVKTISAGISCKGTYMMYLHAVPLGT